MRYLLSPLVQCLLSRALKAQEASKRAKQLSQQQVGGPDTATSRAPTTTQTREDDPKVRMHALLFLLLSQLLSDIGA
jgi:hypothetical protein